jgi:hypothetical protein
MCIEKVIHKYRGGDAIKVLTKESQLGQNEGGSKVPFALDAHKVRGTLIKVKSIATPR